MILLRILGSALIILGSFSLGYLLSINYKKRPQQLRELQGMLTYFENQVSFMSCVLKDALFKTGTLNNSEASVFFTEAAGILLKGRTTAQSAWKESIEKNIYKTAFNKEDMSILMEFGNMLGSSDYEGQMKNIRLVLSQLKIQETKAEEEKKKNQDLYFKLTALGGAALVIVLI